MTDMFDELSMVLNTLTEDYGYTFFLRYDNHNDCYKIDIIKARDRKMEGEYYESVSYTHLTLPTKA